MTRTELLVESVAAKHTIVRTCLLEVLGDGSALVETESEQSNTVLCDVLEQSTRTLDLGTGDEVLVWLPGDEQERGIVLGRIGPSRAASKQDETPEELVIEAKKNLTFKCGEGSITLRKDGKILIKGKDLVSQARRINRIKGGAVTIN